MVGKCVMGNDTKISNESVSVDNRIMQIKLGFWNDDKEAMSQLSLVKEIK